MPPRPIMGVTSDLHLELNAWKNHPALAGDAYYGLEQIVDICLDNQVKAIALLGDVFNVKTPDPHTVSVCYTQIERCKQAGVKVPFLQGQHELSRSTPWLDVHPWPMYIHKLCLAVTDDIIAYGLDWTPPGHIKQALAEIPREANLLLCHQVWGDFHGSKIEHECNFTDVPGHVHMLITGDYHKHFTVAASNGGKQIMAVASPGSTCLQSINEDPDKAFFLLYDDRTIKSVLLKSRWIYRYTVNGKQDLSNLLDPAQVASICRPQEGVPLRIAKPILQVVYDDNIPNVYERIMRAFHSHVHLFLVPVRGKPEEVQITLESRRERAYQGLAGALPLVLPAGSETLADCIRLNNSPDPVGELEAMQEEFLRDHSQRENVGSRQGDGGTVQGDNQEAEEGQDLGR